MLGLADDSETGLDRHRLHWGSSRSLKLGGGCAHAFTRSLSPLGEVTSPMIGG